MTIPGGILYWLKHDLVVKRSVQEMMIGGIVIGIASISVILVWLYEKLLAFMMKRGGFNDHLLHQKLTKIIESFGKKTELLLKGFLCRDKFLKRKNAPTGLCTKDKCRQHRTLLKQRS